VKLPLNYAPSERAIIFQYTRDPGFSFSINTNRTLHTTTFKIKDISSTAAVPNDAAWHHVAVVHNAGANMQFYVDGALAATVAYTNGAGYRTSSEITIGAADEGANWFTGNIDRIRFDNRVLTATELDSIAGTARPFLVGNPNNAASAPQILDAKTQPDGSVTLTWTSIGGKRYRVQSAPSATGPFADITRDAEAETDPASDGQPSTQSFTDLPASADSARFYRIQVVP
jgi:hypothetical protein